MLKENIQMATMTLYHSKVVKCPSETNEVRKDSRHQKSQAKTAKLYPALTLAEIPVLDVFIVQPAR